MLEIATKQFFVEACRSGAEEAAGRGPEAAGGYRQQRKSQEGGRGDFAGTIAANVLFQILSKTMY